MTKADSAGLPTAGAPPKEMTAAAEAEAKAKKIMIVEDEGIVAMQIKSLLLELGYEIAAVSARGEDAINKAAETMPDLILMDIRLAGEMSGIEAAGRIRETLGVPVIYLTANADEKTIALAKPTQPYGYLIKPLNPLAMNSAIEMALYRHDADLKRRQLEMEKEKLISELQEALATIKTLRGIVPICSYCKKIRDDRGYWNQLEVYISKHTEADFSHGLCPDCLEKYYSEFLKKEK